MKIEKNVIINFFNQLVYETDIRSPPDEPRRRAFKAGWTIAVKGEEYKSETLSNRLTWDNLGYRYGKEFGSQSSKQIDYIYQVLAESYQPSQNQFWWFGINNTKTKRGHVIYSEIEAFLLEKQKEFAWSFGGSAYSKSFYSQIKIGDKVILWMGHGDFENWGVLGFSYISDIKTAVNEKQDFIILSKLHFLQTPFTPYPKKKPQETENTILLKSVFGLGFPALHDVFSQVNYVQKRSTPVTIDKVTSEQYSMLFEKLTVENKEKNMTENSISTVNQMNNKKSKSGKKVLDRNSIEDAEFFINKLLSHYNTPKIIIEFLVEKIEYANKINSDNWNLNLDLSGKFIRFNLGKEYCIEIKSDNVYVVCLKQLLPKQVTDETNTLIFRGYRKNDGNINSKSFFEVPDILMNVPNSIGIFISSEFEKWLPLLDESNSRFIEYAITHTTLWPQSKNAHSVGAIGYLSNMLNRSLPNPDYALDAFYVNEVQRSEEIFPDEITEELPAYLLEGAQKTITINVYERNSKARSKCKKFHGVNCVCCGFNFYNKYGDIGKDFIHIHHIKPISEIKAEYQLNPTTDLIPVCPNCHAMIHSKNPPFTIEEIKTIINQYSF